MVCFIDREKKKRFKSNLCLGYLCIMYDEDGTAHVGSSSSCQSLHAPSSLFVST